MSGKKKAGIGAGIAATAAAAALGAYLLYGSKNAKQNRRKVKGWALQARREVLERVAGMKNVTAGAYAEAVNKVIANYRGAKNADAAELAALAADLKKHWRVIKPMFQAAKNRKSARPRRRTQSTRKRAPKGQG